MCTQPTSSGTVWSLEGDLALTNLQRMATLFAPVQRVSLSNPARSGTTSNIEHRLAWRLWTAYRSESNELHCLTWSPLTSLRIRSHVPTQATADEHYPRPRNGCTSMKAHHDFSASVHRTSSNQSQPQRTSAKPLRLVLPLPEATRDAKLQGCLQRTIEP